MISELRHQALGIYHYIVLTRQWISSKGGVYIKENDEFERITPSAFTKALADFAARRVPYRLKIAVNNAQDPDHLPTEFEKQAILQFEKGEATVFSRLVQNDGHIWFNYAAPLVFENECVNCHSKKITTEVLGCISVSFPADTIYCAVTETKRTFTAYLVVSLVLMLSLLYLMLRKLVIAPLKSLKESSDRIEQGQLDVRVDLDASEEWAKVAGSFNRMVESLANQQKRLECEVEKAVSELSKAYEDLKQVERYKSEFFSNITHDLKTPITAIKGATELLEKRLDDTPKVRAYLDIQKRNVQKLSAMVEDLLDCARIESGGLELHTEETDLAEVVEDAILMVTPIAMGKGVEIRYDVPRESMVAPVDRVRLEQAISNLLSNAIKFSPKGYPVEVRLVAEDNNALISVEDYGPGISEEEQERVFQKFFRRSNEKASEGMGLGLAIAKGIVEAHGGRIWVSQPQHQGVILNISLPLNDPGKTEEYKCGPEEDSRSRG